MREDNGTPLGQPAKPLPRLMIEVRPDGKGVNVTGPIANKLLCWRMLTDAAAAILNFQAPSQIVVPDVAVPHDLTGGQN